MNLDSFDLLEDFNCPITGEPFEDPVIADDGHTYEKSAILKWFQMGNLKSPLTNAQLRNSHLIPNHRLKSCMASYKEKIAEMKRGRSSNIDLEGRRLLYEITLNYSPPTDEMLVESGCFFSDLVAILLILLLCFVLAPYVICYAALMCACGKRLREQGLLKKFQWTVSLGSILGLVAFCVYIEAFIDFPFNMNSLNLLDKYVVFSMAIFINSMCLIFVIFILSSTARCFRKLHGE